MRRRTVLALCGSGLAGCTSGQRTGTTTSGDGETTTSAGTTSGTATPPDDVELSVEFDALQPALVALNVDYLDLHSTSSSQYLFLRVSASADPAPARSDLSFRFDGGSYPPLEPTETPDLHREFDSESAPRYEADGGSGWVIFELPETGDAGDAAFVWPGGEWRPDGQVRARLAAPFPPLSVERWEVEPTVALGGRTSFRVAVTNAGDVLGRFVGGINAEGWQPHRPIAVISRQIPPGETVAWDVPGEEVELVSDGMADRVGDGEADIDYEFVWPGGSRSASVRVVEG
ncbi:hypothetical protein [Halobaculum sp. EA56]|uniref:hypothetical protein n=1 Tax=Halobaculum sp. EA56 TaxID=3421648 RepID=UPI003EB8BEB3